MNRQTIPVTDAGPVLKVTVYLKSGSVVTFPGRYTEKDGYPAFMTQVPVELPYFDLAAVEMVIQEPYPETVRD